MHRSPALARARYAPRQHTALTHVSFFTSASANLPVISHELHTNVCSFKYSLFHECIPLALTQSEYTKTLYYSPFPQDNLKWDCQRKQKQFKLQERRGTKCLVLIAVQTGNKTSRSQDRENKQCSIATY